MSQLVELNEKKLLNLTCNQACLFPRKVVGVNDYLLLTY